MNKSVAFLAIVGLGACVGTAMGLVAGAVKALKIDKKLREPKAELKVVKANHWCETLDQEKMEKDFNEFLEKEGWNCQETKES